MIEGMKFCRASGEEVACVEIYQTTVEQWQKIICGGMGCGNKIKVGDLVINFPPPFGFNILCSMACFEKECKEGIGPRRRCGQRRNFSISTRRGKFGNRRREFFDERRLKPERRKNG